MLAIKAIIFCMSSVLALNLSPVSSAVIDKTGDQKFTNAGTFKYTGSNGQILESTYYVSTGRGYWDLARSECQAMGASLLSIETSAEDKVIRDIVQGESYSIWASGSYEGGTWKWDSTNQAIQYTNWGATPNPNSNHRTYLMYNPQDGSYGWYSYSKSTTRQYICERTTVVA